MGLLYQHTGARVCRVGNSTLSSRLHSFLFLCELITLIRRRNQVLSLSFVQRSFLDVRVITSQPWFVLCFVVSFLPWLRRHLTAGESQGRILVIILLLLILFVHRRSKISYKN